MKQIVLIASCTILSIAAAFAQQETNTMPSVAQPFDSLRNYGSAKVDTTSMVKVKSTAIPVALRNTLKSSEYSGWKKGTIYHDPKTKGYILQLSTKTAGTTKNPNWFKFDSNGKRLPDPQVKIN